MSIRDSHTGKTYKQKQDYNRFLPKIDYEPTIDDSLQFNGTEKAGEDLTESTIKRKRPISINHTITEHISENWLIYLIGAIVIICLYLINESRIDFKLFDYKLIKIGDSVDKIEKKVESHDKTIIENDIKIKEIEKRFK
jgi:hypothetical protein